MFNLFSKIRLSALLVLLSLNTMIAEECCEPSACNRLYVGAFGGGLYSTSTEVTQTGTVFFPAVAGGPLAVNARGRTKGTSSGFIGAQIGYEWTQSPVYIGCSGWSLAPAFEIEGYWSNNLTKNGHLINPTDRLPEHDFLDSLHMDMGVYLANAVFSLNNLCLGRLSPYIGGGIGAANIAIRNATSFQTSPAEPGINHFNSKRDDSAWAFAAQVKAGLRYKICKAVHFFAEYRYLFVNSSHYNFGPTEYLIHAPTSSWNVKVNDIHFNAFALGIQYDL